MTTTSSIETESRILASRAVADLAASLDDAGEDDFFVHILLRVARCLMVSPKRAVEVLRRWTPIRKVDVVFFPDGTRGVDIRTISPDDRRN